MTSDFILLIICRIHQIQNPKRPLFRVKSQKNDTIGSATLIAPEITSGIKPEMYGSLFSAHVGHYCLENYCVLDCTCESLHEYCHECILECVHCRVTGSPSVCPLAAIKGGEKPLPEPPIVQQPWLILGVLALALLKFV